MATKTAVPRRRDAFAVLGDAIAASAEAMKKSASDARAAASEAVPAVRSALGKAIYVATYYASYGVVLAADALAYGVHDGAAAAREAGRNDAVRAPCAASERARVRRPRMPARRPSARGRRARRSAPP